MFPRQVLKIVKPYQFLSTFSTFSIVRPPIEEMVKMTPLEQSEYLPPHLGEKYRKWHREYNSKHKPKPGFPCEEISEIEKENSLKALEEMREARKHSVW